MALLTYRSAIIIIGRMTHDKLHIDHTNSGGEQRSLKVDTLPVRSLIRLKK